MQRPYLQFLQSGLGSRSGLYLLPSEVVPSANEECRPQLPFSRIATPQAPSDLYGHRQILSDRGKRLHLSERHVLLVTPDYAGVPAFPVQFGTVTLQRPPSVF